MRIGINALFLQKPATGVGQHLIHLLQGLDEIDRENEYVLLSPRLRHAYTVHWPELSGRFRNVEVATRLVRMGENIEKLWWEQVGLVGAARREKIDLLHSPYWAGPIVSRVPEVMTVHDVIHYVLPEYAWRRASRAYLAVTSAAARRADAIIAVSECSRRDIERCLNIPAHKIHVIGNAVDASFQPLTDTWQLDAVRERYEIGERYVLYFGGFDVRKNVPRLIRA